MLSVFSQLSISIFFIAEESWLAMDLLVTVVKESPGLCRCCLFEGCYKDLTAEYPWMSETEVYADMLRQCFGISLSQQSEGPDGATNLICEVCITRLRDACHFKKQVLDSERTFVNTMLVGGGMQSNEMAHVESVIMTQQEMTDEDSEDLIVTALEEPEVADDNVMSYEMDALIKHEVVKEEVDVQAAREDLQLSDEDDGASCCDVSRDASPPALGAECDWSRVFGCRVKMRDARDELLCSQCGEWSLTAARLQRHRQTHATRVHSARSRPHAPTHTQRNSHGFTCDVCGKTFARRRAIIRHIRAHSGVKPYPCNVCKNKFTDHSSLKRHLQWHSGVKPYSCDICDKAYTEKGNLKTHKLVHSGVKPYTCEICSKCFNHSCSLKKHLLTHSKLKPYSCEICSKSFNQSAHLKSHLLTHSKLKPYSCEICSKSFNHSSTLKRHMLTHSKLKPYSCEICSKSFKQSTHLKRHLLTHSKLKPFACDSCTRIFAQKRSLKKHKLVHSGVK